MHGTRAVSISYVMSASTHTPQWDGALLIVLLLPNQNSRLSSSNPMQIGQQDATATCTWVQTEPVQLIPIYRLAGKHRVAERTTRAFVIQARVYRRQGCQRVNQGAAQQPAKTPDLQELSIASSGACCLSTLVCCSLGVPGLADIGRRLAEFQTVQPLAQRNLRCMVTCHRS